MKALSAAEIRERFLRYYEDRGHTRMASDSLVPANDPTLLFTGAGMNQFKDMFLGRGSLPTKRVTTAQKCIRVPDLENVGRTPRHHTMFEMLGHFSFGDYFKAECIRWEWEFFTKELGIPAEQLVVTIYRDDDEAFAIWRDDIGLEPERIFRFGEKENFWPAEAPSKGPNGPCGPCSEIYFDAMPGTAYPSHDGLEELPDDRFTEIGNCVFTQYERRDGGELAPLPQKNIDVGLGLERIAAVLVGAPNNFETDLFRPYLEDLERRTGKRYGDDASVDTRMRRIADHVRAVTFCIADGALPSNEGRGYVVRKILRRAVRDGYELGLEKPFLCEMVDIVGAVMGDAYPEVREHAGQCRSVLRSEEESFATVYRQGRNRLDKFLAQHEGAHQRGAVLSGSGEFAFELHDTYGFPIDITRQMIEERGLALDEAGFESAMTAQRERARSAMATADAVFADNAATVLRDRGVESSRFVGYEQLSCSSTLLAILDEQLAPIERAETGARVTLVVEVTPFYAQGGGQVGDRGSVASGGAAARIENTTSLDGYHLHAAVVESGGLAVGESVELVVDEAARRATERNHTATHLLHAALKRVVGEHVNQAGSEVSPERLRFDYTSGERLSRAQIEAIETMVLEQIMAARVVEPREQSLDDARSNGFVALFGEKYGDRVRTLAIGEFSKELCGGTHVANSGNIGGFRIVSDGAVSAGTRRIEAVTGPDAMRLACEDRVALTELAETLKVPGPEVPARVAAMTAEIKSLKKELQAARAADLGAYLEELKRVARITDGVQVVVHRTKGLEMKEAQELLQRAKQALDPLVAVLFVAGEGGVIVCAAVSKDQTGRVKAGDLVKAATQAMGGGGGGRPDAAQGKGKDPSKLDVAVGAVIEVLAANGLG